MALPMQWASIWIWKSRATTMTVSSLTGEETHCRPWRHKAWIKLSVPRRHWFLQEEPQVTLCFLLGHKESNYQPAEAMPNLCDGKNNLVALLNLLPESSMCAGGASVIIWISMLIIVQVLPQTQIVCLVMFTGAREETIVLEHLCLKGWYFLLQRRECRNTCLMPMNVIQLPGQAYSNSCFMVSMQKCHSVVSIVEHELPTVRRMLCGF